MKRTFVHQLFQRLSEKPRFIQVVLGPRQVGKTTGVLQLKDFLDTDYQYENADAVFSSKSEWLKQIWLETRLKAQSEKVPVLVIDEVQSIPEWSTIIKGLWDMDKVEKKLFHIILLGSSSLELHHGLNESLAGRFEYIHVPHWNFQESRELVPSLTLEEFMDYGGYPEPLLIAEKERRDNYLRNSILEPVITKDILQNVTVKRPGLFRQAFEITCLHAGEVLSLNKFLGQLQEGGNVDLVKHYLSLYEMAFLVRTIEKYSTNKIQKKSSSPKLLPLAPAFLTLFGENDRGRKFELVVGNHLLQKHQQVFYWREGNHEVDYVVKLENKLIGIEVKSGRKMKLSGLEAFSKKFQTRTIIITPKNFHLIDELIINC